MGRNKISRRGLLCGAAVSPLGSLLLRPEQETESLKADAQAISEAPQPGTVTVKTIARLQGPGGQYIESPPADVCWKLTADYYSGAFSVVNETEIRFSEVHKELTVDRVTVRLGNGKRLGDVNLLVVRTVWPGDVVSFQPGSLTLTISDGD